LLAELTLAPTLLMMHLWEVWRLTPDPESYRPIVQFVLLVGVASCLIGSLSRLRETRYQLGMVRDQLKTGWKSIAGFTLASLAGLAGVGLYLGQTESPFHLLGWFKSYVPTVVFQQLGLQLFLNNRIFYLTSATPQHRTSVAVWLSTLIFVLLHSPNIVLMIGLLWAGYFWCRHFRENLNLAAVLASHLVLGVAAMMFLGRGAMLNLRVGYPALEYLDLLRNLWE
jgi:hypothetical protein